MSKEIFPSGEITDLEKRDLKKCVSFIGGERSKLVREGGKRRGRGGKEREGLGEVRAKRKVGAAKIPPNIERD